MDGQKAEAFPSRAAQTNDRMHPLAQPVAPTEGGELNSYKPRTQTLTYLTNPNQADQGKGGRGKAVTRALGD
jgi:hypothetical protein